MFKNILNVMHTQSGQYVISIILGIGLSTLFRKACENRDCIVFRAPPLETLEKNTYRHNNKCYNFKEMAMKCGSAPKSVKFE